MNKKMDPKLITEFYDLYSDIIRTAGLSKVKKNRLERFRNEMAVDFYNLNLKDGKDVTEFSNKYQYCNISLPNVHGLIGTTGEMYTHLMIQELKQQLYDKEKGYQIGEYEELLHDDKEDSLINSVIKHHERFKSVVDKAIDGQKMTDNEIAYIQDKYFGLITQGKSDDGLYRLNHTTYFSLASAWVLNRALYDFVIHLSRGVLPVVRCQAPKCGKLLLQRGSGSDQQYCDHACKMRAYRKRVNNKKIKELFS